MAKKNILSIGFLLLTIPSWTQKISIDSLTLISKVKYCEHYGITHVKFIVNGKDACITAVEEGEPILLSKNITLGILDSIEIFLVGRSSYFNKFQFIMLHSYDGNIVKNLNINDLNNFSAGSTSLSITDKSFIFLFSRYTALGQYFFTLSQEAYVENLTIKRTSGNLFNLEKYKVVKFSKGYKVYVLTKKNTPMRTRNIYEKHLFIFNKKEELIHYSIKAIELDNKVLNKKW